VRDVNSKEASMRLLNPTRMPGMILVVLTSALGSLAAGCGGGDDDTAALSADRIAAFESPYCVTARTWAVHELDGDGDDKAADPAAFETYWREYVGYRQTALEQSPPSLRDENAILVGFLRTRLTPVLEKYDFDVQRIESEGSPAEKSLGEPPPRAQKAQDATHAYDNRICGYGGSPEPADVTFEKSPAAKPYCAAAAAQEEGNGKVAEAGFTPAAFRAFVTSDQFLDALDQQDATAPPEIAEDVETDNAWVREHKLPLLEKYGYDYRKLLREGTAEELAEFNYFDPAIEKHDSRVSAYVQQVCGVE
jgi:hypothetical protein